MLSVMIRRKHSKVRIWDLDNGRREKAVVFKGGTLSLTRGDLGKDRRR